MRIFNPIVLLISGALLACTEAKEDSQEIPSEMRSPRPKFGPLPLSGKALTI
jgi:hypothetical protein